MIDPSGHSVFNPPETEGDLEGEELPDQEAVDALEECLASGLHNTRTDDDGYCERCGFQFIIRESEKEKA